MRTVIAAIAFALWGACEGTDGLPTTPDAELAPTIDGSVAPECDCTVWGRVSTCPDGTPGCDAMVCLSHEKQACPGPWPCLDGGQP
jgi:hypothetical protein